MTPYSDKSREELLSLVEQQADMIALLLQQVEGLQQEIKRLKGGSKTAPSLPSEPPAWVKPNTPSQDKAGKPPRKKRANAFVRPREQPTEEVVHACSHCPDCGRALSGGTEYSRRQIIELPEIPVCIRDQVRLSRYCGVCQKSCVPAPDLSNLTVGESRFGQRVHALVGYLRQVGRLPLRSIASLLSALCRLRISVGEVNQMLSRLATAGASAYAALQKQLRASRYVHGDETGWRENGQNGYLWSFSTPQVAYFTYPKTRAGSVVTAVLGQDYGGIVVSDFYTGYNTHFGLHQRCWVHLLRDVQELSKKYPLPGVLAWAQSLRALYEEAKAFSHPNQKVRAKARVGFQEQLVVLATPYPDANLPQSTLCKRLLQFESELFTFVEYPEVPSQNNAAERAIRPRVIARKISGGTRSPAGSQTMAVLTSLFATWQLRGEECLSTCVRMLADAQKPPVAAPA